jgi:hypothetical protein
MQKTKAELTTETNQKVKNNGGSNPLKTIGIELRNLLINFIDSMLHIDSIKTTSFSPLSDNQTVFTLPTDFKGVYSISVNGVILNPGDYSINLLELTYTGSDYPLETTDSITILYLSNN